MAFMGGKMKNVVKADLQKLKELMKKRAKREFSDI